MENGLLFIGIGVVGLWIGILTYVVFRMVSHYNQLTVGATGSNLKEVLSRMLDQAEQNKKYIASLEKAIEQLEKEGKTHFQRLGIVRFNPFSDTGGSQSFTLALLDGHDNGIVITSLYARTGNRWYIKHIQKGSGTDVELSKEEQSAIKKAKVLGEDAS